MTDVESLKKYVGKEHRQEVEAVTAASAYDVCHADAIFDIHFAENIIKMGLHRAFRNEK